MQIRTYSDDLYSIITKAGAQSKKYYHTFCGTPHLFLSLFSFLSQQKNSERYGKDYTLLKDILNKYGIEGKKFEEAFLACCPKGTAPVGDEEFKIVADREYQTICSSLQRLAVENKRSMEVEDFIMELFSDRSFTIFQIFTDITGSDSKTDAMYNEVIKTFKPEVVPEIAELEEFDSLTNLNQWVKEHPVTVIDGDEPVSKLEMALSGRNTKSAILTGKAGCGKSTYVYELAQRINRGEVPANLVGKIIYELDCGALLAGTRYRGDMEERLMNILSVCSEHPEVILFVDEIHQLVSLGASSDGASSAGNMIKPYLTKGQVQIIGATTNEEYTKNILPDKAFASRFHEIKIEEPSRKATFKILSGILPTEIEFFKKEIKEELLHRIIELSEKYSLEYANPRKAIDMLELACAYSRVFQEKNEEVNVDDIIQSIKLKYNIYISDDKMADTKEALFKELLGQDDALNQVLRNLKIVDRGITDIGKPLISMLLCGPTGTGKTQACKIIAKNFFGSEDNLIKINMGEYSSEMDVSKLSGSSAGYVGYEDEPALIKAVREKPNSLVLFDEIEKANPAVQKILLNILDEGEMRDNKGNRVSFRNCIVVFTTNLGCNKDTGKATGMGFVKTTEGHGKSEIMKAIEGYFSPEFLGRLDDIVFFNNLPESIIKSLINRYLAEYTERADDVNVKFSKKDIEEIIKNSEINTRGARGVRKAVRKQIVAVEDRESI